MKIYIKEFDTILETDDIVAVIPGYKEGYASVFVTIKSPVFSGEGDGHRGLFIPAPSATRACEIVENIAENMGAKKI